MFSSYICDKIRNFDPWNRSYTLGRDGSDENLIDILTFFLKSSNSFSISSAAKTSRCFEDNRFPQFYLKIDADIEK